MWLLLITPDAESLVGRWRAEHTYAARFGIPAHVTVRTPFLPPERWRDPGFSQLERFLPTDVTLARLEAGLADWSSWRNRTTGYER